VLLADDHPVMREGLSLVLGTQPDLELVGEAASGGEAIALARQARPDVILMDLEMPGTGGVEAIRRVVEDLPDTRVVVYTAYYSDEQILGAMRAGASGYLLKGAPREEIFRAVRAAKAGGSLLEPIVASRLIRQVSDGHRSSPSEVFTAREREVLQRLARGLPNKEIAAEIGVTERTVKFHVSSILTKLGATNRTEAVMAAATRGLVSFSSDHSS
jgi:DNA-binding NarL/FixJ family response regulator